MWFVVVGAVSGSMMATMRFYYSIRWFMVAITWFVVAVRWFVVAVM